MIRPATCCILFLALACLAGPLFAGVTSGTVESVTDGKLVIKLRSGKAFSFTVNAATSISLNGKRAALSDIKPGTRASVFTDGARVTRVIARATSGRPKPKTKPTLPKKSKPRTPGTPNRPASNSGWFQYRGPNRDNKSTETGLLKSWPESGPRLAWSVEGLGSGYSTVSIAGGIVVTMGNQGNEEAVLAVSLRDGSKMWRAYNGQAYRDGQGDGPRGTPTIDGNRVYALGGNGQLSCLDLRSGKSHWTKNILKEAGARNIRWGISESVLIDGNKLICTPGGSRATMLALDKNTGRVLWRSQVNGAGQAGYASAIVAEVGGVRQYVQFTHNGVIGVRANDGTSLWAERSSANGTANCSTPLFFDNCVFSASGYGTGGALLQLTSRGGRTAARRVYHTRDMKNHHGGMVHLGGHIYGSNDPGILTCLEAKSGRVVWRDRSVGKASLTYADGHLYVRSERGPVALVEATPDGYREKGRFDQPQRSGNRSWSHPVVAEGKLFLRDMDVLLAYDVRER